MGLPVVHEEEVGVIVNEGLGLQEGIELGCHGRFRVGGGWIDDMLYMLAMFVEGVNSGVKGVVIK